ncbi:MULTISPECIES: serine/threonine-protein kinase [Cryobacterium]|uniref:serine/threonine-protein kinase n=1 Tax=Cryobacterium TaxID=69578 RepID=UPI00141B8D8A|nr:MULTISPECIES: serine/threonine-protein kinase [Cryobacterium]
MYEQVLPEVGSPELQATMVILARDGWTMTSLQQIRPSEPAPRLNHTPAAAVETTPLMGRRYLLDLNPVGEGGFGAVFFATDTFARFGDPKRVAVKKLLPQALSNADAARRFRREIKIISGLSHPNVLPILDSGQDDADGDWYAMPIADGGSLKDLVPDGIGLDTAEVLEVLRQVAAGIQHLHTRDTIHRDLTPGNVLLVDGTWMVSDFGLSVAEEWATGFQTTSVFGMGTGGFISPEQATSFKDVTHVTDIYSLGKLTQYMTTGNWPTSPVLANNALHGIIQRATQHDPDDRHQNVGDFLAAVEIELGKPPAGPETPMDVAERYIRGLRAGAISRPEAKEIMDWMRLLDPSASRNAEHILNVGSAFTWEALKTMWAVDPGAFEYIIRAFCKVVLDDGDLGFAGVDAPARVIYWADSVAQSPSIRQIVITSLCLLGSSYNRWMVADLIDTILKSTNVKTLDEPTLSGFRAAGDSAAEWALSGKDFENYNRRLGAWLTMFTPAGMEFLKSQQAT